MHILPKLVPKSCFLFLATGDHHVWLFFQKPQVCEDGMTPLLPDYSEYSASRSRMIGIHSMYSGIGIASQPNGCFCLFWLFLSGNRFNRTHPKSNAALQSHLRLNQSKMLLNPHFIHWSRFELIWTSHFTCTELTCLIRRM